MAKDLRPKAKQYRRLGIKPESNADSSSLFRSIARRDYPPGVHGHKGRQRQTDYGIHLQEKQRVRLLYGILERQLSNYFKQASRTKGNTGLKLMELLERRLDNVIFRSGMVNTRRQARQLINHGHFLINKKKMNIPSYLVKKGDVVNIKKDVSKERGPIAEGLKIMAKRELVDWLAWDSGKNQLVVLNIPVEKNLQLGIDTRLIVEYYSK
ncbi:MAG: 30S ribosomal protein S4 [Patescibacteria group bacterium]